MTSDVTLELLVGTNPKPAPRELMESLTKVEVTNATKEASGFDLSFAVSTRSKLVTELLPKGYFDPPTRIIISVTVKGRTTVLMDGVITRQDLVPSDRAGESVLSIKGEDLTRMMDLIDLSGFPFPALPAELRVALMIAKYTPIYKVVPLVIPSVLVDVPNPLDEIPAQQGTDLAYARSLAATVGYSFYLQPGPIPGMSVAYWGPMLRAAIPFLPQPTPIAIDWDGRSNVESLKFGFDGFAKTIWIVIIQTSTIPIPIPVPDINPISPPLGKKSPLPLRVSPMSGLAKYTPLQAAAIALGRAAMTANVVAGSGTLDVLRYGSVLPARTVVEVRGAGITYDGQYFVDSTTHSIRPGSYTQSFSLSRNALIAGSGVPGLDVASYATSPVQELASFAPPPPVPTLGGPPGVDLPSPPGLDLPSPPDPLGPPGAPSLPGAGGDPLNVGRVVPMPASP